MWVAHVHITWANVTCMLEVGWRTDHGPVDPPDLLPHSLPLHTHRHPNAYSVRWHVHRDTV
jgi:hypothetical protein